MPIKFVSKGQGPSKAKAEVVATKPPPWENLPGVETAQQALEKKAKYGKQVHDLMLVHRVNKRAFTVLGYDPETQIVKLRTPVGADLRVKFTPRENNLYDPLWR